MTDLRKFLLAACAFGLMASTGARAQIFASPSSWAAAVVNSVASPSVVKASPGVVSAVQCDNLNGATAVYIQIINAASAPALGTNVIGYIPIGAGATGGKVYPSPGLNASAGISIGAIVASGTSLIPTGTTAITGNAPNCEVVYK